MKAIILLSALVSIQSFACVDTTSETQATRSPASVGSVSSECPLNKSMSLLSQSNTTYSAVSKEQRKRPTSAGRLDGAQ